MKSILLNLFFPKKYWTVISNLGPTWNWTSMRLIVPSIVLAAITYCISILLYKQHGKYSLASFKPIAVIMAVGGFLVYLQVETVLARLVSKRACGKSDFATVYNLVCFSLVPILIAAIVEPLIRNVEVLPTIAFLAFTLYSLTLLYFGTSELLGIRIGRIKRIFLSLLIAVFPFLVSALVLVLLFILSFFMNSRAIQRF